MSLWEWITSAPVLWLALAVALAWVVFFPHDSGSL